MSNTNLVQYKCNFNGLIHTRHNEIDYGVVFAIINCTFTFK